ncbi:RNA polymerase sigma factor [Limnoglobus roseus]|uniref:RNA polymerase subunit sigma-70 n=1 Tax=Limnoglobus roseus TaxID=2598579 RepID=A0A5C1ABJ8_9BACT|nr:RNA polymerase sigma factor [Limnoglobus roseus]QEL14514.1 RNA polymerase subunit sigma-70 [Limnoglobus roseus]
MASAKNSLDHCPDEKLLERLRTGQRDVLGPLVRRYERELYGYLRRYLGDDELAADVFQNTFVAVFLKIKHYEPGRPARPWLYAIATNQAIDALRRQKRRHERTVDSLNGPEDGPDTARSLFDLLATREVDPAANAEGVELAAQVRQSVDQLPDLLRQAIILAYFQGLKYQEIADALDIPLGTVKSRLNAAMTKLAELWQAPTKAPTREHKS